MVSGFPTINTQSSEEALNKAIPNKKSKTCLNSLSRVVITFSHPWSLVKKYILVSKSPITNTQNMVVMIVTQSRKRKTWSRRRYRLRTTVKVKRLIRLLRSLFLLQKLNKHQKCPRLTRQSLNPTWSKCLKKQTQSRLSTWRQSHLKTIIIYHRSETWMRQFHHQNHHSWVPITCIWINPQAPLT